MSEVAVVKDPERLKVLERQKEYELNGSFDLDTDDNPPQTRLIEEGEVDYTKKRLSSKIKTKFAFHLARKFVKKVQKMKMLQIKEIKGVENLQSVSTGAVLTCNHFNAFDSFAVQLAYEAANFKKKKMFRVIREGNYTDFPGLFGFLMRNCNTLPLSSNKRVMMEFVKGTNELLQKGNLVLIYPEQGMWWNYRKPRPLKDGAFKFAARNNVPVVPIFITMEDSDVMGPDGFPVQAYTINIDKPIYPDKEKELRENIDIMKEANSKVWKRIYEDFYKQPLAFSTKDENLLTK